MRWTTLLPVETSDGVANTPLPAERDEVQDSRPVKAYMHLD